jgi:hypothetical protein
MKTYRKKSHADRGSVLAVTLVTCTLLASSVGSYLYLTGAQNQSVTRSQNWNQALVVAEAGVDEALAMMNSGVVAGNFNVAPYGSAGAGVFTNAFSGQAARFGVAVARGATPYYQVVITNAFAGSNPVILSTGYVPDPRGTWLSRTIRVDARPRLTFPVKGPMIVLQTYNANGNNVNTDSFNSTNGAYNPASAGTNGDVVCFTTNANSIIVGNGNIHGTVRTPPGGVQGVTATIGSNGSVGDNPWVNGGHAGFETGHFQDDFTAAAFPDAGLPNVPSWNTPLGSNTVGGVAYANVFNGGNYAMSSLSGSVYVNGNVVLKVTSSINLSGSDVINISSNSTLTIYMSGATTSINGNGVANSSGRASAFAYYGLPSNTTINITGNGSFAGTIYAPEADFNLKGSGKTAYDDFTGASVTKTTTMSGNFNFHYDESLSLLTTLGGYDASSWKEL